MRGVDGVKGESALGFAPLPRRALTAMTLFSVGRSRTSRPEVRPRPATEPGCDVTLLSIRAYRVEVTH